MPHQYDNFDSVYDALKNDYSDVVNHYNLYSAAWFRAKAHYTAGEALPAIYDMLTAIMEVFTCLDVLFEIHQNDYLNSDVLEGIYWANKDTVPDDDDKLTMSAILEAMDKAEPHQPLLFIGYLEAYKASTWNATFEEEWMAELVRKWAIWG